MGRVGEGLGARDRPGEGGSLDKCLSPPSARRGTASPCGEGQSRAGLARGPAGVWLAGKAGLGGPLGALGAHQDPSPHADGCLSRPRSPPTSKLLPSPFLGRSSFSDPGVPRPGRRPLRAILQAPSPHRCGPESTLASTTCQERWGCRRGFGPRGRPAATCGDTCSSGQL